MEWLFWVLTALVFLFAFVLLFGAPYLPTLRKQSQLALDLLDLKPGQTLLELGSGDGTVLRAAAARGIKSVGYELNPLLALYSYLHCWPQRRLITVKWGNFWRADWPPADGIYVFMIKKYMVKLDKKIIRHTGKNVKVVSYAMKIPGQKVIVERDALYLYHYGPPATGSKKPPAGAK